MVQDRDEARSGHRRRASRGPAPVIFFRSVKAIKWSGRYIVIAGHGWQRTAPEIRQKLQRGDHEAYPGHLIVVPYTGCHLDGGSLLARILRRFPRARPLEQIK